MDRRLDGAKPASGDAPPTDKHAARVAREAEALRENLRRRKQQARSRKAPSEPKPDRS